MADGATQPERDSSQPLTGGYLRVEGLLLAVSVFLLAGAALLLAHYGFTKRPEIVLTMVILLGIVLLLVAIGAFVILLRGFGLTDKRFALGLPDGSVRAILALSLILSFSMISILLYWDAAHPLVQTSVGVTTEQFDKLAAGSIVSIVPGAAAGTFNVGVVIANPNALQLGQQLMTILGTLVTAIAAFYFGAASVASASRTPDRPAEQPAVGTNGGGAPPASGAGETGASADAALSAEEHAINAQTAASIASQSATLAQRSAVAANQAALRKMAAAHPVRITRSADARSPSERTSTEDAGKESEK